MIPSDPMPAFNTEKLARLSLCLFAGVMAFSVFACFYLSLSQLDGAGIRVPFKAALSCVAMVIAVAAASKASNLSVVLLTRLKQVRALWFVALAVGICLRAAVWWLTLPEIEVTDGIRYLELAKLLRQGREYMLDGYAFWPPGTPFIYAAFMRVTGQSAHVAVIVNLAFFVLAAVSVRSIVHRLGYPPVYAGLSVAALAVWPELFLVGGMVSKESILLGLLPCVVALLLSQSRIALLLSGLVAGLAVLTQPALMLLPIFLGLGLLVRGLAAREIVIRLSMLLVGMVIVVSPWSYRNYRIFGEFVPVSTNAGFVLHAGNQKAMVRPIQEVGGFIAPPMPDKAFSDDLAASKWHAAEARAFIGSHPADFLTLVFNRLILTMGDDSQSAFHGLRLTEKVSPKAYFLFKGFCNAFWLMSSALLGAMCWAERKGKTLAPMAPVAVMATAATLCLMAIHGMTEGGGRHHMGWAWIYSLFFAFLLQRRAETAVDPHASNENVTVRTA